MDKTEKFKVWDKVKVVRGKHGIPIGTTGFISEIHRSYPFEEQVKITYYRFISEFDNDYQGMFNENELELCKDDVTIKFIKEHDLTYIHYILLMIMGDICKLLPKYDYEEAQKILKNNDYIRGVVDCLRIFDTHYQNVPKIEQNEEKEERK